MPLSTEHNPAPSDSSEEQMEFKPVVKYAAIGLAVAAVLGVEYATYRFGFSSDEVL